MRTSMSESCIGVCQAWTGAEVAHRRHLTFISCCATMVPPMTLDRRDLLKGLSGIAASVAFTRLNGGPVAAAAVKAASAGLPRKQDFDISDGFTYLNAAYTHPIPRPAADAARAYLAQRNKLGMPKPGSGGGAGEGFNVVTDWLHFDGALVHLLELRRGGLDVRIVRPTGDYRIAFNDVARAVNRKTRLIELSSTTMYNGFQHDLKAICDLAHAHGAYVYADIIHTAGAEPFDVKASGVDFAACSSFKWLMGDYGLGFLYARDDLLERIRRPLVGYYQAATMAGPEPPFDNAGASEPVSWTLGTDATSHFEAGSIAGALGAGLAASLAYVKDVGVGNIQAYRKPLLQKLRDEVPRRGFTCVTPPESTASIITFARKGLGA